MKILPVLDLLHGQVVHGQQGKRELYQPIRSVFCENANPLEVIEAFGNFFSLHEFYIADLNAIQRQGNNFGIIAQFNSVFPENIFLADIGVRNISDISVAGLDLVDNFIIGTETLESLVALDEILRYLPSNQVVISLDLRNEVLWHVPEGFSNSIPEMLQMFSTWKITSIFVIDISKVGARTGPCYPELERIRANYDGTLIVGGGVRDARDLASLEEKGFDGALIATAFHTGTLSPADILPYL